MRKDNERVTWIRLTRHDRKAIKVVITIEEDTAWSEEPKYEKEAALLYIHFLSYLHPKIRKELLKLLKKRVKIKWQPRIKI